MSHQHRYANGTCICCIIPPHLLEAIVRNGTQSERLLAQQTLLLDEQLRSERTTLLQSEPEQVQSAGTPRKNRLVYTTANSTILPGTLVRRESQGASSDVEINEAYDGLGATFDLFSDVYGRNSIDDRGMDMIATAHYGDRYNNAFFNGSQMVFGDGDGSIFGSPKHVRMDDL